MDSIVRLEEQPVCLSIHSSEEEPDSPAPFSTLREYMNWVESCSYDYWQTCGFQPTRSRVYAPSSIELTDMCDIFLPTSNPPLHPLIPKIEMALYKTNAYEKRFFAWV
jgi:hypothetical protein